MNLKDNWNSYKNKELESLETILKDRGFTLAPEQPHITGERFLMQAVTTASGKKLILYGTDQSDKKVVIKATSDDSGKKELQHERECRSFLKEIDFAADTFHTPEEIAFFEEDGMLISVNVFISQPSTFLERNLEEQFTFALSAFKAQEGAHATTYKHIESIRRAYQVRSGKDYVSRFKEFIDVVNHNEQATNETKRALTAASKKIEANTEAIERYCRFLTHTDFVPHNVRIDNYGTMYLLDYSSLVFGNKHEGWARFLNFMTLYNPELEKALLDYVRDNRAQEEYQSLHLMRLYRLGEIIRYYVGTLEHSTHDLYTLNKSRVAFWTSVLEAELNNERISQESREAYILQRDSLRSPEEKKRQVGLH